MIIIILEVCTIGASKTMVVYGSNLNFATVTPYLDSLTKNGSVVSVDGNPLKCKTTEKGKELLALLKKTQKFF
ncbi:MAG: winged helix-turn-helix domain-containing protein [Methanotrichaceae archaeon]